MTPADIQLFMFLLNLAKDTAAHIEAIRADKPGIDEAVAAHHAEVLAAAEVEAAKPD